MDHPSERNSEAPAVRTQDVRFGPGPDIRQQNERFRVYHDYSCDTCGATYRRDVIEGVRAYIPPDRR